MPIISSTGGVWSTNETEKLKVAEFPKLSSTCHATKRFNVGAGHKSVARYPDAPGSNAETVINAPGVVAVTVGIGLAPATD